MSCASVTLSRWARRAAEPAFALQALAAGMPPTTARRTTDAKAGPQNRPSPYKLCTAAIAATATTSATLAPRDRSLKGRAKPCMIGPMALAPARYWVSL